MREVMLRRKVKSKKTKRRASRRRRKRRRIVKRKGKMMKLKRKKRTRKARKKLMMMMRRRGKNKKRRKKKRRRKCTGRRRLSFHCYSRLSLHYLHLRMGRICTQNISEYILPCTHIVVSQSRTHCWDRHCSIPLLLRTCCPSDDSRCRKHTTPSLHHNVNVKYHCSMPLL